MSATLDVQTAGAALVIGGFVAAEAADAALSAFPGVPLLWWINLELFRPFEAARATGSPLWPLFGPGAVWGGLLFLALTGAARILRIRLGLALAANGAFGFAACLAAPVFVRSVPGALATPQGALLAALLAASASACLVSHLSFLRAVAGEHAEARRPDRTVG